MKLDELQAYVEGKDELVKIEVTIELGEDLGEFFVTKTKETYLFEDEYNADAKVSEAKDTFGFTGIDKKFKPGKVNKAGDVVRPDYYQVVAKFNKQ